MAYITQRIAQFKRAGLVFDVSDAGPLEGAPVVLLHGWPQGFEEWDQVAEILHARGYRTIVPLMRGTSPGARPRSRFAYRQQEIVADVVELIVSHGLAPAHVVGHDWGAMAAWGLASARPDLVRTLTAISVPHPRAALGVGPWTILDQMRRSWYAGLFQIPWLPERLLARQDGFIYRRLIGSGQTPERVRRDLAKMADPETAHSSIGVYRGAAFSSPSMLKKVSSPTLMIGSDADVAISPVAMRRAGRGVDGPFRLEMLPGVSHWIPDEKPEVVADLVLQHIAEHAAS
ncbi:alpha/beta fold hydrolase [Segniliparus rugosus]|uniref:AB hydrolase-1 domain-containing protein n=1 Tax=Segniliparus rugosus (strain ATCC BAA-974 / DSM 45345 / CCUG 50838 / CIP 108380 / JCM 13579 / CDC 945) TaxID=679197 RepID=E5XNB0_SEGRC|nr:alpha/beta fold hydrolase [Segniliparus rugosus]EFV14170.1 hypothetical protein HMPREF9336_00981 [Segniliparus rugosus ATCC BAA-974]